MARRNSSSKNWRYSLLGLLIAAGLGYAQWRGWMPTEGGRARSAPSSAPGSRIPPQGTGRDAAAEAHGKWKALENCRLVEDRGNDGDSFVISHAGKQYTLRLYFVDCPEKHRNQYNGPRLADQGKYFGGLTEEETLEVGQEAREFSLNVLRSGPFSVLTRWEPVFDSGRSYAFVTLPEGDLAELLVSQGLARIYTKGEARPGGNRSEMEKNRLYGMERRAREADRGAWRRR